jgi:hypothetical protein
MNFGFNHSSFQNNSSAGKHFGIVGMPCCHHPFIKDAFTFQSYTFPDVLLISPRFMYLIAGLCSLYMALLPLLSGGHGPTLFIVFWIGAVLLPIAAIIPPGERSNIVLSVLALGGSTLITALLYYQVARFGAPLRFGFVRLVAGPYQPTTFDRVSQVLTRPVLIALPISSVASLLISALMTVRLRRRRNS